MRLCFAHSRGDRVVGLGGGALAVDEPGPRVDPEVDEERPRVLREEDGRPADLEAAVLEVEHGAVVDAQLAEALVVLDELAPRLEAQLLPVHVAILALLDADGPLHVQDGARLAKLESLQWKLLLGPPDMMSASDGEEGVMEKWT